MGVDQRAAVVGGRDRSAPDQRAGQEAREQAGERALHFCDDVLKCRASASIIRARASFSVWPVAWTFQATATATHSPSSLRCTSTSNCIADPRLVALGKSGMAGGFVGDRMIVVGGHGAAHAHGADDAAVLDEGHRTPAEDELIVTQRRDVIGEELALGEPLFEIE